MEIAKITLFLAGDDAAFITGATMTVNGAQYIAEEVGFAALASIDAAGLACVRGSRALFRDLSFRAEAGRVLVIEGPNGSGKPHCCG